MGDKYFVTGNEAVSIPTIKESDGSIEGISFLHMASKGMLEMCGDSTTPLLRPFLEVEGERIALTGFHWEKVHYWIPVFHAYADRLKVKGTILAPIGERGFCYRIEVINAEGFSGNIRFGLEGCWSETFHSINESKKIEAKKNVYTSGWNHNMVFDLRTGISLFAFAPIYTEKPDETNTHYTYSEKEDGTIVYEYYQAKSLNSTQGAEENFWFGLGFEEVAAATAAKEMLRQGFQWEYDSTCRWLAKRERFTLDKGLDSILNSNMFFSFFFGSGITLDTEEFVLVTSRSPRYYVSAAYWDRDSLLWCFPAILMTDTEYAKEMLQYVFTKQRRNFGIHSRYIDGTVLEPGFELDELCAPVLALHAYVHKSGDTEILQDKDIHLGVKHICNILEQKKHPKIMLYETFLQPTDDMHVYRYLTYDNVLVWKLMNCLAELFQGIWEDNYIEKLKKKACDLQDSIAEHCVKEQDGKRFYAWSVDLNGKWDIYDEPPGSLMLLPYYGFCSKEDEIWRNTIQMIRRKDYAYSFADCPIAEIGCAHAPHPWVLSICNSLLSGNEKTAKEHLLKCSMDNGIACESVDEYTGESRTGDAFATCAGFLAFAINEAFGADSSKDKGR